MCSFNVAGSMAGFVGSALDMEVDLYNGQSRATAARKNAARARSEAARALVDESRREAIASMDSARTIAAAEVQMGGSGFAVSSATMDRVLSGSRQSSTADILQMRANAFAQAEQWRGRAADYRAQKRAAEVGMAFSAASGVMRTASAALGQNWSSGSSVQPTPVADTRADAPAPTQVKP